MPASSHDKMKTIKIAAASACLLVAALLLANTFGIITLWGGPAPMPAMTPEEVKQADQAMEENKVRVQEQIKAGAIKAGG